MLSHLGYPTFSCQNSGPPILARVGAQAVPGYSFLHFRALITASWFSDCAADINSPLDTPRVVLVKRAWYPTGSGRRRASNREVFVTWVWAADSAMCRIDSTYQLRVRCVRTRNSPGASPSAAQRSGHFRGRSEYDAVTLIRSFMTLSRHERSFFAVVYNTVLIALR